MQGNFGDVHELLGMNKYRTNRIWANNSLKALRSIK